MDTQKPVLIQIGPKTILITILLVILVIVLYYLRDLVLLVLTAIVIASSVEPATKRLVHYRVPRVLAVILIYALIIGAIAAVFYAFVPTLLTEASALLSSLPQFIDSIDLSTSKLGQGFPLGGEAVERFTDTFSLKEGITQIQSYLSSFATGFWGAVRLIFGGVLSFILILVLSFYFAVQETGVDDFLRVVTPLRHQKYAVDLWRRSQHKIGLWMQGQLLLGLIVGLLTYLGLTIIGVPYALLLAIAAAFFELIPLFGIILALVPALAISFADGGITMALLVLGLYMIIQQFENHLIYPLVVKKVVGVPALLVILALIIGGKLAGFLGLILSVPIAAALQELVSDLEKRRASIEL